MITNKTMSDYIVQLFHRYNTTKEFVSKLELQEVLYRYVERLVDNYSRHREEAGNGATELADLLLADLLINVADRLIESAEIELNEEE